MLFVFGLVDNIMNCDKRPVRNQYSGMMNDYNQFGKIEFEAISTNMGDGVRTDGLDNDCETFLYLTTHDQMLTCQNGRDNLLLIMDSQYSQRNYSKENMIRDVALSYSDIELGFYVLCFCIVLGGKSTIEKFERKRVEPDYGSVELRFCLHEKFLQLFATEAYASAFLDRKKQIDYKHLSSVVGKRKRFDFLADFVPEKVKAQDALKEVPTDQ
ncbi:DNA polymerase epsilon subunit C [Tanacetum coccineum]